jgi:protein phosphatase
MYDVVGDVHGCADELEALLAELGYADGRHPEGRRAVFVGDLVDRGPDTPRVLRTVMAMDALVVSGNHEAKLVRALDGRNVRRSHGLQESLDQLATQPREWVEEAREWMRARPHQLSLDDGRLIVAHAGLSEALQGQDTGAARSFALYGDTTGRTDEHGLPERLPWQRDYRGAATVVYGHTPVSRAEWVGDTLCLDTGAVFGGRLTALRWPERELVDVAAARQYVEPSRPLAPVVR